MYDISTEEVIYGLNGRFDRDVLSDDPPLTLFFDAGGGRAEPGDVTGLNGRRCWDNGSDLSSGLRFAETGAGGCALNSCRLERLCACPPDVGCGLALDGRMSRRNVEDAEEFADGGLNGRATVAELALPDIT